MAPMTFDPQGTGKLKMPGLKNPGVLARGSSPSTYSFAATGLRPDYYRAIPASGQEYGIVERRFGTPAYPITSPRFYCTGFISPNSGALAEVNLGNDHSIGGIAISKEGSNVWTLIPGSAFMVPNEIGFLSPANSLVLDANAMYRVRTAFSVAPGGYLPGGRSLATNTQAGGTGRQEVQILGASDFSGQLLTAGPLTGGNQFFGGYAYSPNWMVALGGDGRAVFLISGDSIGAGAGHELSIDLRGNVSPFEKALDDGTVTTRYAFMNASVPGSRPSLKVGAGSTVAKKNASFRLVPNQPFTKIKAQDGVNSINDAAALRAATMPDFFRWLKATFPDTDVHWAQMMPHDAAQTKRCTDYANQIATRTADETYPNGSIWTTNAQAEADLFGGLIAGTSRPWQAVIQGTGDNDQHSNIAITPLAAANQATLGADYTSGLKAGIAINSPVAPQVGETLVFNPDVGATSVYAGPISAVTPNGTNAWTVSLANGVTTSTIPAGTVVRTTGAPDGVHIGPAFAGDPSSGVIGTICAWKAAHASEFGPH